MRKLQVLGWILSGLIVALLVLASAVSKFVEWDGKADEFAKLGWTTDMMFAIGIVEVAIALLFIIPRTAFVGAILLTGYLGGATATHVRVGDAFVVPIIVGIVAWIALGLRNNRVFALAVNCPCADSKCETTAGK